MIKRIALTSTLISLLSTTAIAGLVAVDGVSGSVAANNAALSVDMSNISTTRHEIALMDVLSEICPTMLNKQDHANFYDSYNKLLVELLPTIEDPQAAMQFLSTQQDYQKILGSVRNWTMGFSAAENKELCEDMARKID